MTIEATMIADSISAKGIRLSTLQLRYPRFIHAELMTHRVFSRNASSSRAIPVERMIEDLRRDPAMPVYWGSSKPGMQAGVEIDDWAIHDAKRLWLSSRDKAISIARTLVNDVGLHKQIANRILEPWAHINVVVTATDWENFFALRRHKDAQPEIKALADEIYDELFRTPPQELSQGDWHAPYIDITTKRAVREYLRKDKHPDFVPSGKTVRELLLKVSVARCARVSYLTHDGRQTTVEEDLALYDRLLGAQPLHASPAEHQATPDRCLDVMGKPTWQNTKEWGNFRGWRQYRKMLPGEFIPG